jgi:uncharacterized membrane protein
MIIAKFLHVLSVVIWVGGMFFAYMALRPVAAERLEPPQRLSLWEGVFGQFFPWVWGSVAVILGSGLHMMFSMSMPPAHYISLMMVLGLVMMLLFAHVFFAPYKRLKRAVAAKDWPAGGAALGQIRKLIAINLTLGLITVTVATLGVYLG